MKGTSFILLPICAILLAGCSNDGPKTDGGGTTGASTPKSGKAPAPGKVSKLKIDDVKEGTGRGAEDGDILVLLYRGTLTNGTEFDSNMDSSGNANTQKELFQLPLGMGQVIKGWDQGLKGIKVGGERKLSIPADLGYGDQANGSIPPNSDLFFDVKCLDIIHKGEELVIDPTDEKVGTGPAVKQGDDVTIHFVGKLLSGKQFDSTRDKNSPLTFKVGNHDVLACLEEGVVGMKKGGLRKLHVPPMAAAGGNPASGIPMNQVLIFEVEVLKIGK